MYELLSDLKEPKSNKVKLSDDAIKAIDDLTEKFQKSYKQIMLSDALNKPPLDSVDR